MWKFVKEIVDLDYNDRFKLFFYILKLMLGSKLLLNLNGVF